MANLRGDSLRAFLLALLVFAVFAPTLVHAEDYTVGVKAGDWIKYGQITVTYTGNGTEPSYVTDEKKMDWIRVDVLIVAGTTATLNMSYHFNNGTQDFQIYNADVQNGESFGNLYLIASNLTVGDALNPQTPQFIINQTITRMYAGANRKVNYIETASVNPSGPGGSRLYFDQNTGIIVEAYLNISAIHVEESFKVAETNLWSANTFDLIQNNLVYIIAGVVVIIVIVAATIVLRRRNPKSPRQAPQVPPSSPPPPP
jgi:hypothetical protein